MRIVRRYGPGLIWTPCILLMTPIEYPLHSFSTFHYFLFKCIRVPGMCPEQACAQMRPGAFKCKCKYKRRIKCKCKCKCSASESNANANVNAQQLNQMQMQMHLNQMQMHLNQMRINLYQMQTVFYKCVFCVQQVLIC